MPSQSPQTTIMDRKIAMPETNAEKSVSGTDAEIAIDVGTDIESQLAEAEHQYPSGWKFVLLTIGLMAVVLVAALDNYIIATAIPKITTQFKALSLVGWYGSSYFLTLMSFQLAHGQLCALFPIKYVYLMSIVVFEIGSVVSAAAPTSVAFIIGRLICGLGGGGLWCGTLTLVALSVAPRHRHFYMSLVTSMYGLASALGPLLGGIFTDSHKLTWRFCFWINLPIGFVAFFLIAAFLTPPAQSQLALSLSTKDKLARIDFAGPILLTAAFACFFLALQWGGNVFAWSDSRVWGCLLGFALIMITFIILQVRLKERATIPRQIVRRHGAVAGCCFMLFISMVIGVHTTYLPFYFQSVHGNSASASGVHILPYLMSLLISPLISGALISLFGHHYTPFMYFGTILATIGSGLLFTLKTTSPSSRYIPYQVITGFGVGICRQIPFSAVPLKLHKDDIATGSSFLAFCNSGGAMLGVVIGQSIFTNLFVQQVGKIQGVDVSVVLNNGATDLSALVPAATLGPVREAFDYALTHAFVLAIPCAALALCSSFAMKYLD